MSNPSAPPSTVSEELEKVLSSGAFRGAGRSAKLLRFLVEETLAGRSGRLKDYTLGAEALGRGDAFDPRTDPIARVEASRLRSRLELYYATEGATDPILITLPKGGYVPLFENRPVPDASEVVKAEKHARSTGGLARRHPFLLAVLALVVVGAMIANFWMLRRRSEPGQTAEMRLAIDTPPTTDPLSLALSPDGAAIAFVATFERRAKLWLRPLADPTATRALAGTDNASFPFWSPDSRSLGFFANGQLKRIDIESGLVRPLTRAIVPAGGAWNAEGVILFPLVPDSPLSRVSEDGGEAIPFTRASPQQLGHRSPQFLPDEQHFLYYATSGNAESKGIYVGDLRNGAFSKKLIGDADTPAVYASGHLFFLRQGKLFAQRFDVNRLEVTGNVHTVAEGVAFGGVGGIAALSASRGGLIAFRTGSSGKGQLTWFDRFGKVLERLGAPGDFGRIYLSLSPDGRRLAQQGTIAGNTDIYLRDIGHGGGQVKLTSGPLPEIVPIWSPNGGNIVFAAPGDRALDLYRLNLTSSVMEKVWASNQSKQATDWLGDVLLVRSLAPDTDWDIWSVTMDGSHNTAPVVRTKYEERDARFSPDQRWIAYQANDTGRFEIYIQPYPGPGERRRISADGGTSVSWGPRGKELFYLTLDGTLVAASVTLRSNGVVENVAPPVPLFFANVNSVQDLSRSYAVSVDGQRFLVDTMIEEAVPAITVIVNWKPPEP